MAAVAAARAKREKMKGEAIQESEAKASALDQSLAITPPGPDATLAVHDGDEVHVKFLKDLSTKSSKRGDPVFLELAEDVKVNGVVVAFAGSRIVGEVIWVDKGGFMSSLPADLVVRMDYLNAGARKVRLRGTAEHANHLQFGSADLKSGLLVKAYIGEDAMLAPAVAQK